MWLRFAGAIRSEGPLVSTSLCGITSLFVSVSRLPRRRVIDWLALNGPPFTDQVWQPFTWWRMTTAALPDVAVVAAEAAPAATTVARAAARTRKMCLNLIGGLLSVPPSVGAHARGRIGC